MTNVRQPHYINESVALHIPGVRLHKKPVWFRIRRSGADESERVQSRHRPRSTLEQVEEMRSMTHWPHDRLARKDGGTYARALCIAFVALCVLSVARCGWTQYRSTQWTADSGLPQNTVRGIVHAADGYLWVATLDGIAKFDGIRFTVFNKSNTPGITSNRFVAMAEGDGGDLWMASEDGNLIRYHAGHFQRMGEAEGLRPYSVGAITYDHRGGVWVDSDDRVYRWAPQSGRFEREAFDRDDTRFIPLWWG